MATSHICPSAKTVTGSLGPGLPGSGTQGHRQPQAAGRGYAGVKVKGSVADGAAGLCHVGGKVRGHIWHPLPSSVDQSHFLLALTGEVISPGQRRRLI